MSKLNPKELEIARALVFFIRKKYPTESLAFISGKLDIKQSNLGQLFKYNLLPSLRKITEIQAIIGQEAITVGLKEDLPSIAEIRDRLIRIEKALNIPVEEKPTTNYDVAHPRSEHRNHDQQILSDKYYSGTFNTLLNRLEETFNKILAEIEMSRGLYFKVRPTARYVSINLIPEGLVAGGHHILMFRHSIAGHVLNMEFVTSKYKEFKEELLHYTVLLNKVVQKDKQGVSLEIKSGGLPLFLHERSDGHASLIYTRELQEVDLNLIVNMAIWTFYNKEKV